MRIGPIRALAGGLAEAADASSAVARPAPLVLLPGGRPGRAPSEGGGLGLALVRGGVVRAADLLRVLGLSGRDRVPLARLLRSHGLADDADLAQAIAARAGLRRIDPCREAPDPRLIDALGPANCIRLGCLPWRRAGAVAVVAVTDPEAFAPHRAKVEARLGPVALAVLSETDLHAGLAAARRRALRLRAETGVAAAESCRDWNAARVGRVAGLGLAMLAVLVWAAPVAALLALLGVLLTVLVLSTVLRLAAAVAALRARSAHRAPVELAPADLPVVSILVPMFREPDIAPRLVRRLGALDYPRDRLDVLLVVEADDHVTRAALATCRLPGWMRVVAVPEGPVKTKPRALNYALNFARGSLVGVYDAEDAPARGQLRDVARAFAAAGPDLACVQGVLDYYNPTTNWLARCFTIEYAAWFRLVLPGFARLGLVVPLGGTTLFFRRAALERLGGWDAHNVTEDADLGVRLARHGYRTELVGSVTLEEANCRVLPWIKQRSRWLKGYAMTYVVHMRDPVLLWRQLGAWRFFGVQVLFLGTLIQFLLAPIFWSLWLLALGLEWAPAQALPAGVGGAVLAVLLTAEAVAVAINLAALSAPRHRGLRPWVLTLSFYFPLATLAAWKAAWEMVSRPFYWDKTTHGLDDAGHRPLHLVS